MTVFKPVFKRLLRNVALAEKHSYLTRLYGKWGVLFVYGVYAIFVYFLHLRR